MKTTDSIKLFGRTASLAAVMIGATPLVALEPAQQAVTKTGQVVLSIDGAPSRGRTDAALTLVEFSDFQCPTSGRYAHEVFDRVQRDYVDSGKVRYVFHNFPLARHPHALKAAEAAQCASEQGRFWELRSILFANQQGLGEPDLLKHALAAGVETGAFVRCFNGQAEPTVRRQLDAAARAGVTGRRRFSWACSTTSEGSTCYRSSLAPSPTTRSRPPSTRSCPIPRLQTRGRRPHAQRSIDPSRVTPGCAVEWQLHRRWISVPRPDSRADSDAGADTRTRSHRDTVPHARAHARDNREHGRKMDGHDRVAKSFHADHFKPSSFR